MKNTLAVAVLATLPLAGQAPKPVTHSEMVEVTAKIEAIDHSNRIVTLKDKEGEVETIYCGPEVKRFSELKVGDTVTFRYYESVILAVRKPGQASGLPKKATDGPTVQRGQGARPGATLSRQETATVVVTGIDPKVPSITVLTNDNSRSSFKVEDKNNIKGLAVGDKVEITYTVALLISVK